MFTCYWLPDLFVFDGLFRNLDIYDEAVYRMFCNDFLQAPPIFLGKEVRVYSDPKVHGKEQTYFHITSKNYNKDRHQDRNVDISRCERIKWPKALIENYNCNRAICTDCNGIKCWRRLDNGGRFERVKILFEEQQYIVILEDHTNTTSNCFFLVTAYHLEHSHQVRKLVAEYNNSVRVA